MLFDQLFADLNTALKSGDQVKVRTLRFLLAAVKKFEIDTYPPSVGGKLTEDDVIKIIRRQVKTHTESIAAFNAANREDLVKKETEELAILKTYLPPEITDEEIRIIVKKVISQGGTNFGQVMSMAMGQLKGKADGNKVAQIVKEEMK